MSTALAAQLAQIAASSKSTLDVKAAKAAHSKSLIFEPRIAASQTYQTLYNICREGYDELCRLDSRFVPFGLTIFSEQSREEDRSQMTAAENAELDKRIESFLRLVGSRIRLMPAIKAIEWLIRRFKIHEYNTALLITTFLPYYSIPAFVTLLDIIPTTTVPNEYRFLDPYSRSKRNPPKSIFVHHVTNHRELLATISEYTLESCRRQQQYPTLISFWSGIMTEAVGGMLDKNLSGRRSVLKDNAQALMHQIGPILSDGLAMTKVPEMQIACYMVTIVLVSKGDLEDDMVTALMEHIVTTWSTQTLQPGLICLSHLAQARAQKQLPRKVTKALRKVSGLPEILSGIANDHRVERLCFGLCLTSIERLYKRGDIDGFSAVEFIVSKPMLSEQQVVDIFKSLVSALDKTTHEIPGARDALNSTIARLSQTSTASGDLFFKAIGDMGVDIEKLELRLGSQIGRKEIENSSNEEMKTEQDVKIPAVAENFERGARRYEQSPATLASSCLVSSPPDIFAELCSLYMSAIPDPNNLPIFENLPPMQRKKAQKTPFFFTFLVRIWCGPYPTLARLAALDMAKGRIKEDDCKDIDFQALVPYCIAALADPSRKVRRAAADLLSVLESMSFSYTNSTIRWGTGKLYDSTDSVEQLGTEMIRKLLHNIMLPTLEECVLNEDHIHTVIQGSLGGSSSKASLDGVEKEKKSRLSHGARLSVLTFLSHHAIQTPLLTVKLRLLRPLNTVKGVSGTSRTALLLPLLKWWVSLNVEEAATISQDQNIDQSLMDQISVDVVVPNDEDGLNFLLDAVQSLEIGTRQRLVQPIFDRIAKMWPSMKSHMKAMAAERLLKIAQLPSEVHNVVSGEAANLLGTIELTTEILLDFLGSLQDIGKLASEPSTSKRRRTNSSDSNRGVPTQVPSDFTLALKQVTFVLQLVEGSEPSKHPQLLDGLFSTLSQLQEFRTTLGSELGYLQNLVLNSLLAIVSGYKNSQELKIKDSLGYGDLLAGCIQKSSSPSVQNTALLLMAELAKVDAELVLHCAMPIFTFMGGSVLRQSDDYSAHVINQTIKEVVPRLIESLRRGKRSPVAGARELLLSFVASFEHIPEHRRLGLFVSLIDTLGSEDFLFALLAMLVDKFKSTTDVLSFASEVFNQFTVEVQLQSLIKLLGLIADLFESKPALSSELLGREQEVDRDPQKIGLVELDLVPHLLSSKKLTSQVAKVAEKDDMDAAKVRELYSTLLEDLLSLAEKLKPYKPLHNRCGDALPKLLNLLSIGEFIKAVDTLLDRPDPVIRRKVLRALDIRIDRESQSDAGSRSALLAFIPQLTAVIRVADDMTYKTIAVECVDKIAEKYGKKDPETVIAAASTIASDQCLGQTDSYLRVRSLLCLSSLVDVLQDDIVPVLPAAIPKCLAYIKDSIGDAKANALLHNAAYSFLSALAQHLPYMISRSYLEQLLEVSSASAESDLDTESHSSRLECLQSLAKKVDAKVIFTSLENSWNVTVASGFTVSNSGFAKSIYANMLKALKEYLDVLGLAIDSHSKADISKNVGSLSNIFLAAFDFRRLEQIKENGSIMSARNFARIEEAVNGVVLRMVYKLNDASFRPIFSQLMDWAVALPKSDVIGRKLRLLGVFGFLHTFFDNLKSIVTSYASYVIDVAVDALTSSSPNTIERELWKKVVNTLAKTFEHDQDSFWQAPAHFSAVAPVLTAQFAHATSGIDLTHDLIPAIVELAAAADSQDHQKELNGALLKHLRSEHAAVRLAAVKCEQKLAERLGEEWLAMLPEMLPYISELQEDDDEAVERETARWIVGIEGILGESLDAMLQ